MPAHKDMINTLKTKFDEHGIILSFTGPFSQGIIEELGDALKIYLQKGNLAKGKHFKLFSIFIEQTQNVKNYASSLASPEDQAQVLASGILVIGEQEGRYYICSGNYIKEEDKAALTQKLETINEMDRKSLKQLYRERLKDESPSQTGGAGLGFIEMARKSNQPFEYSFTPRENGFFLFTLNVHI